VWLVCTDTYNYKANANTSVCMARQSLNGVEIGGLNDVADAFEYLSKSYNDGELGVRTGNGRIERVILTSRSRHAEHFETLRDSEEIEIADVYATTDGRLTIEVI